jgi:hypothetical protein
VRLKEHEATLSSLAKPPLFSVKRLFLYQRIETMIAWVSPLRHGCALFEQ